jgi:quinol monooxygenase YgiN
MNHHPDTFVTVTRVGTTDENKDAILGHLRDIVALDADEPGTLIQSVQVSRDDPNELWIYEVWASQAALEDHRKNGAAVRARLQPLLTGPFDVHTCTPLFGHGVDFEAILGT